MIRRLLTLVYAVHNIAQKIGYPTKSPNIEDPDAVQNYYAAVNISQSTFFGNTLSTMRFATNLKWSRAGKPTNHDEWIMSAPTVNVCGSNIPSELPS